jgi:hypothetical protein
MERTTTRPRDDGGPGPWAKLMTDLYVAALVILAAVILIVLWATSDGPLATVVFVTALGFIGGCLLVLPLALIRR